MTGLSIRRIDRPSDLVVVEQIIVDLAKGAALLPDGPTVAWLMEIGVAAKEPGGEIAAHPDWLTCSLPANSVDTLVIRTLLRDPLYRLHIDLMLADVFREIGATARWARMDELLLGPLRPLAPRLAALLREDCSCWADGPSSEWSAFDRRCWGVAGAGEVLFPILVSRLPEFASTPVYIAEPAGLDADLVVAASIGEGLRIGPDDLAWAVTALYRGIPLWMRLMEDGTFEVSLVTPTRVEAKNAAPAPRPFSLGVQGRVREGSKLIVEGSSRGCDFWCAAEGNTGSWAFTGTAAGERWPAGEQREKRQLPDGEALNGLVGARRSRDGAPDAPDQALTLLASHPLYGLWIQVLLLEALDRELGEETLSLLCPPSSAGCMAGATRVYYRPRPGKVTTLRDTLDLGLIDPVLDTIASSKGIRSVGVLGDAAGPWSHGLHHLSQLAIVQNRQDRWSLTPHALDRLHGGGLMTSILRRGKGIREDFHETLLGMWTRRRLSDGGSHA